MNNTVGSPVFGKDFAFREKSLRKAIRYLKNENSFLILGIRRTGKSSFLKQTAFLLRKENDKNICIELDCQTFTNVYDFYKGLYNEMPKSLKDRFKKFLDDSKRLPKKFIDSITDVLDAVQVGDTKIDFQDKLMNYSKPFEELVTTFFKETENVFLFLDEVPFFFENIGNEEKHIKEITQILTNLRSWRHAGLPIGITGSLNLHQQLEHLGISRKLLAGLNTIELEPLTKEESRSLINKLLESEKNDWWTPAITERLLDLMPDFVPYFLQYAFNEIVVEECRTPESVEEVFHNEIMGGLFKDFIYQFDERLAVFKGGELKDAMSILDIIALEDISLDDLQDKIGATFNYDILVKLIDNEFITLSGNQEYSFTLQMIKNWWIQKRNLK